jgi:hypothetical protein
MRYESLALAGTLVVVALAPAPLWAQTPAGKAKAAKPWTAPRTADGQPDLQGVWSYATLTPLQRPRTLGDKAVMTEDEAAKYERDRITRENKDRRDTTPGAVTDVGRAYNEFWWDRGTKVIETRRTALVIDPADGRVPSLTPLAKQRGAERATAQGRVPGSQPTGDDVEDGTQGGVDGRGGRADTWEDRSLGERCILFVNRAGPPMTPSAYNNNFQLFQSANYVVILNEQAHDSRIVPLDNRPHLPGHVRQWLGDSRGHWEGDTLVVETKNLTDQTAVFGSGPNMQLVERFKRTGPDSLMYEFTVNDPESFTRPWTAQIPVTRTEGHLYEYACHEGNYGMFGILAGARKLEQASGVRKGSN